MCQQEIVSHLEMHIEQVGEHTKALEDYKEAIKINDGSALAFYNLGITKDRIGDFEGAVQDFSSAINLDPSNADFYHNRGFAERKKVGFGIDAYKITWLIFI